MTFLPVAFVDEVFQHAFAGVAERIAELEAQAKKRKARMAAKRKAAARAVRAARPVRHPRRRSGATPRRAARPR
jgi:hypothetical protein